LSDEKGVKKRIEIREQLLEWMSLRIRDQLNLVVDSVASGNTATTLLIDTRVISVLATLDQVHAALSAASASSSTAIYPVDAYPLLCTVINEMDPILAGKRVTCAPQIPRLMSLIAVQPDQLKFLFKAVLEVLLTDAAANSALEISATENEDSLLFTFSNTGFGIPDESLQAHLWQTEYGLTEEFKDLRQAIQPVADWGGEIEIHSEVGTGMHASLRLAIAT